MSSTPHIICSAMTEIDLGETSGECRAIEDVDVKTVRAEPYTLPEQFLWSDIDIQNENQLEELYTLLGENYVEDDENMFRFAYSPQFLQW